MHYSRYSQRPPSESTATSNRQRSPVPSEYEYLGRLVTRERPIVRKSKSIQQNLHFPQNKNKYQYSMGSHRQETYKTAAPDLSTDEDADDSDGLNKPLGVIRISDRHYREIYRLPTPPPTVKRVFHRLRSPEPKIIERVYVRRPPPQIIENVIEVPAEKVRIIKREKYLERAAPITRSKLVHLKSKHQQRADEQQQQQYEESYTPSEQYSHQQTTVVSPTPTANQQSPATTTTKLVYPPQANMRTVGYITSTVPPEVMFNSKQPLQMPDQQVIHPTPYDTPPQQTTSNQMIQPVPQQTTSNQMIQPVPQPTTYNYPPQQQPVSYQMVQSTPFTYPPQQSINHPMVQPTPFTYPPQQSINHPMVQPTPFTYPSQQMMPFSPYGYPRFP